MDVQTSTCSRCRNPFEYIPMMAGSVLVTPDTCGSCLLQMEERSASVKRFAVKRELDWLRICPADSIYNQTSIDMLPCPDKSKRVMEWAYGPRGMVLFGVTGLGKTRTLYLLLKRLHDEGKTLAVFDPSGFAHAVSENFSRFKGEQWIASLVSKDVLALDDFGKAKFTPRQEGEFFGLLEKRCSRGKPCLFTLNQTGDELQVKFRNGAEIVRRMRQFCESIYFK